MRTIISAALLSLVAMGCSETKSVAPPNAGDAAGTSGAAVSQDEAPGASEQ